MNSFIGGVILLILVVFAWGCATKLQEETPKKTKENQAMENTVSLEGKIVKKDFYNKIGRKIEGAGDYFFETGSRSIFIKRIGVENITKEILQEKIGKTIKIKAIETEGLWDTDDPNVQSRFGPYLEIVAFL